MTTLKKENKQDVALALCPPDRSSPLVIDISKALWTAEAISLFGEIVQLANKQKSQDEERGEKRLLPTEALRNLLHSEIPELLSTNSFLGLGHYNFYRKEPSLCCLIKQAANIGQQVVNCIEEWIESDLTEFIERQDIPDNFREEVYGLLDDEKLIYTTNESVQLYPWSINGSGTSYPPKDGFPLSANDIASILEGCEIFPNLPPVRRIAGINNNKAELISVPIDDHQEGRFSLVCEISIETLPASAAPIIYINFKKRRWLDSLNTKFTRNRSKNCYLIESNGTRAYRFKLEKTHSSNWKWAPDSAFSALSRKFNINFEEDIDIGFTNEGKHFVGIAHDYESEGDNLNKIGAGVPEKDRKDAFNLILEKLSTHGFSEFDAFERIKNPIKAYSSILYFNKVIKDKDKSIKSAAADYLHSGQDLPAELFNCSDVLAENNEKNSKVFLPNVIQAYFNQDIVKKHFEALTLYLLTQSPSEAELLKQIAQILFGENITIKSLAIPKNVHGTKDSLPSCEIKNKHDRKLVRQKRWEEFLTEIPSNDNSLCLIQAPKFYDTDSGVKADDEINKPASKLAFTSISATPVQYLLPPDKRSSSTTKLEKYVLNTQQALLDLVFGHLGLLPGLDKRTNHYHQKINAPRYLYGINVFAATTETRAKVAEIAVASRINIESGITEIKILHKMADGITTNWMSFTKAIQYLAKRNMHLLSLGNNRTDKQSIFQQFCIEILDEAEQNTPFSYVFFKAEGCRQYWSLLTDNGVSDFAKSAKKNWPSLRIIRVREQAPKLVQEKISNGFDKPTTTVSLFKIISSNLPVYWSLGEPVQQYTRGLSCYRTLTVSQSHPITKEVSVKEFSPDIGQSMRPNAAEFVVISAHKNDEIDEIIQFSSSLRRGIMPARLETWVKMPSPLFVMNKLEEYLKL